MKHLICLALLLALVAPLISPTKIVEAENSCQNITLPNIFISEIAWVGSSKSTADEWLEITNHDEKNIDISNWTIGGAATNGSVITLPESSQLFSNTSYLIANYSAENNNSVLNSPPNYITTAVSLSNSSLGLTLRDEDGCVVDEAGDGGAPFFGGTSASGSVSMIRQYPVTDGTLDLSWAAATSSSGFDSDTPDLGTPGTFKSLETNLSQSDKPESIDPETEKTPEDQSKISLSDPVSTEITENFPEEKTTESPEGSLEIIPSSEIEETPTTTEGQTMTENTEEEIDIIETTDIPTTENNEVEIIIENTETNTEVPLIEKIIPTEENQTVETQENNSINETPEETSPQSSTDFTDSTTTEMSTTENNIVSYPVGTLIINEFVSDPINGEKEWVEIINPYNNVIPLDSWKISESSGRTSNLSEIYLGYGQITVAEFSSGALNNDTDTIYLLGPNGEIIDQIIYGTEEIPVAIDPNSVARDDNGIFQITATPTKGLTNAITNIEEIKETTTDLEEEIEIVKEPTEEIMVEETNSVSTISTDIAEPSVTTTTDPPTIRLSELYPNTGGSDAENEFIELENFGPSPVDLFGLKLVDAAENFWEFSDRLDLAAGQFLVINRSNYQFALNNSGSETIRLYSAQGILLDEIQYENAPKEFTFARHDESWCWTNILTPNEPNAFPETIATENTTVVEETPSLSGPANVERADETESFAWVTLSEARSLGRDKKIIVEGIVMVKPGILGSQIFYITDNDSGIQIYKSDGNFPDLEIGDRIEVSGTTSSNRGEPRIKISKSETIITLEENLPLSVTETEVLDETLAGKLVKISGVVTEKSSNKLTVETPSGSDMVEIKIKDGTAIVLTDFKPGDDIQVAGIVGQTDQTFYLLPRSPEDLVKNTTEITATNNIEENTVLTGKQIASDNEQKKAMIIGGAVVIGLFVYSLIKKLRSRKNLYEKRNKLSLAPTG